ncbi:MAG: hypothetical protein IJ306_09635 [Oscillospiraceae bacterium]|nr:hypothetical protein [Oscillospiraceae bacterium]
MNNIRRKRIEELIESIEEIKSILEEISEDEEQARDNMPESLWGTERYEKIESACENLSGAYSSLEEACDYLQEAKE